MSPAEQHQQIITWTDPRVSARRTADISGLDYLLAIKNGTIQPPPAARLTGYRIADVGYGYTEFTLDPGEQHYNLFSTVHGGIITTLLDTSITSAVLSTLPIGITCATAEIKVNFVKPVTIETGRIKCTARPIHLGKRLATAEGRVQDQHENLFAHGVATCIISRL